MHIHKHEHTCRHTLHTATHTYIFTNPSARAGYDTRSSFPSPRLVASPRLQNLVCSTIYP